jgi:tetratricopeptide (TPR) repeat protein
MPNTGLISPSTLTDLAEARMEAERAGDVAACERARRAEQASAAANAGRIDEAREFMAAATAREKDGGEADPRVLFAAFQLLFRLGEHDESERLVRRRLSAVPAESPAAARAYTNLGLIQWSRGELDLAAETMRRAVEIDERLGDEYGLARDLGNLALVPETRGDLDEAEALYRRALAIAERIGADEIAGSKLANLGDIALRRGQKEEARALWTRAIAVTDRTGGARWRDEFAQKLANLGS